MIDFPNCKINLGLHILSKREDGFHNLETIFYPIFLRDGLEIIECLEKENPVSISLSGLPIDATHDNICIKAYQLLKQDFNLPPVKIHLHKIIPTGAGLGGGSADGAFTLLLLNKKFHLGITKEKLLQYALQLGSDCPFFLKNRPCFATSRGEILEEINLDLSAYKIVLVYPKIHITTAWAFSKLKPNNNRESLLQIIKQPVGVWQETLLNDFEEVIFQHHPEIASIKTQLYNKGAVYASMSGSGSTIFALFEKEGKPFLDFPKEYFIHWSPE